MTRARITAQDQGSVCKLRGWRVKELLVEAGIKPYFAGGGWIVDAARMPDLLAYLERRRIAIEVIGSGPSRSGEESSSPAPQTPAPKPEGEAGEGADVPLWGPWAGGAA